MQKKPPIFGISLNTNFLPTQLIYFMLRRQSRTFHILNANLALYSNSTESIKLIDEFIAPYISDIQSHLVHLSAKAQAIKKSTPEKNSLHFGKWNFPSLIRNILIFRKPLKNSLYFRKRKPSKTYISRNGTFQSKFNK